MNKIKLSQTVRPVAGVALAILLGAGSIALAAPPVVKTVPWVASNPLIPHDIFSGETTRLKGTSDLAGAGFQYSWDFGDGSPVATGTVTNAKAVEASHVYTGSVDDIFTARLTVENTATGETGDQVYYVQIRDKNLETEVNVAIDEGLWNLHKSRVDTSCGRTTPSYNLPCSHWGNVNYSNYGPNYVAVASSTVNAFEAQGHLQTGSTTNPYAETVRYGIRYVLHNLVTENLTNQTYPAPTGTVNPDSNSNGIGIRAPGSSRYPYVSGQVMDAMVTSGTQAALAETGPTNVFGRAYSDIVQDLVDSYAFGQYNANSVARGGWRYVWNQAPDNSAAQWAAIGMIPAERVWGLTVPQWVKDENLNNWLHYSQYSEWYSSTAPTSIAYGCFGYSSPSYNSAALVASGMVQLAFDDVLTTDSRWQAAEKCARYNWTRFFASGADYYAMFALAKSMRQANPPVVELCSAGSVCDSTGLTPIDWYNADTSTGDPANGFARQLVNRQSADGSWSGGNRYYINKPLATPWSILILGKTLFEAGSPVAVAEALPNPAVAGQLITLDGSNSFHQDSTLIIDSWEWDLDNDGAYDDATGPTTTISFPAVGDYPVGLRVTDDDDPEKVDTTVMTVRVTTPPVAPTADADGPYVFCPQAQPWFMDGTGSVNPDEGVSEPGQPGDTIQSYAWELDGDNAFNDAFGPQPDVTAFFTAAGTGDYLVQLKVTDTTATSFPSSGFPDLSDTDTAQVSVKDAADAACGCIDNLAARAKDGKVQLTWTDSGANHYNVYRSTTSGGPYSLLASTTSTYSTYLDTGLVNGTTYYYVVREAALNGDELCQSNEASATPVARVRRR